MSGENAVPAGHDLAEALLDWYDCRGRHDLPWKKPRDAYRIWVSEIMLQQTRVTTVVPYFEQFTQTFPTVTHLARASRDAVLHHWAGLGYYARARNMHRAARIVAAEHAGALPADVAALQALPGIGRSTAGAIAAMAFDQRAPILDGNVKRVLTRLHALRGWPGERALEKRLWALAEHYTPDARVADYTQALMDLGATLCTRRAPACAQCPLSTRCAAHASGLENEIPAPRPKRAVPERATRVLLLTDPAGHLLLSQRPAPGVWGGMWSFPELADEADPARAARALLASPADLESLGTWPALRHGFTHFRLTLTPLHLRVTRHEPAAPPALNRIADADDGARLRWIDPLDPPDIALAAPVRKLLPSLARPAPAPTPGSNDPD